MSEPTEQDLDFAAKQLCRSEKGVQAAKDLLALLDNGGVRLDFDNQSAVFTILRGAWTGRAGTALSVIRNRLIPIAGKPDQKLVELGLLDTSGRLTDLGRSCAERMLRDRTLL